jgi:hypothetical protein
MEMNMKYPKKQFEKIVEVLKILKEIYDLENLHEFRIYALVLNNISKHREWNALVKLDSGRVILANQVKENQKFSKVIETDESFVEYPEGINDNHIKTAIKAALKLI